MCQSTKASLQPEDGDTLLISIPRMRKFRPREFKQVAQENTAGSWQKPGLEPRLSGSMHIYLTDTR